MEALRRSVGSAAEAKAPKKPTKKPRKASAGQKEMLMPIAGKKPAVRLYSPRSRQRIWSISPRRKLMPEPDSCVHGGE
jgi:hypothetical protein